MAVDIEGMLLRAQMVNLREVEITVDADTLSFLVLTWAIDMCAATMTQVDSSPRVSRCLDWWQQVLHDVWDAAVTAANAETGNDDGGH